MSGSADGAQGDEGGNPLDSNPLRLARVLACGLLGLYGAMLVSACPLPTYDIDPELNLPPEVDVTLVEPKEPGKIVTGFLACGEELKFELKEGAATTDPEGEDLFYTWFLNLDIDNQAELQSFIGTGDSLLLSPCALVKQGLSDDVLLLEAYILDTEPDGTNRAPTDDGNVVVLRWTIELIEEGSCDGC